MTLKDEINADAAEVFLEVDDFAESVIHWPSGESGSAAPVTALVFWDDAEKVTQGGKKFPVNGTLHVSSGLTLSDDDVWVIGGINYQAVTVGQPAGGLVEVEVKYVQKKHTTLNRRTEY